MQPEPLETRDVPSKYLKPAVFRLSSPFDRSVSSETFRVFQKISVPRSGLFFALVTEPCHWLHPKTTHRGVVRKRHNNPWCSEWDRAHNSRSAPSREKRSAPDREKRSAPTGPEAHQSHETGSKGTRSPGIHCAPTPFNVEQSPKRGYCRFLLKVNSYFETITPCRPSAGVVFLSGASFTHPLP